MSAKHSPRKVTLAMIKGKPITTSVPVIHYHASDDELQEIYPSTDEEKRLSPELDKISHKTISSTSSRCTEGKYVQDSDNSENNSERSRSISTENILPEGTPPTSLDPWKVLSDIKGKITKTFEEKLSEMKSDKRKRSRSQVDNSSVSDSEDQENVISCEEKIGDKQKTTGTLAHRRGNPARYVGFAGISTGLKDDDNFPEEYVESGIEAAEFTENVCEDIVPSAKADLTATISSADNNSVAEIRQQSRTRTILFPEPINFSDLFSRLIKQLIYQITYRSVAILIAVPCIHYVTPLPEYLLGFLTGIFLTVILHRTVRKLGTILSTFADESFDSNRKAIPVLEIPAVEEHAVVERFQGWLNELPYTYEPSNYHVARTKSVFFRLEENILRITETRMKIPKKAIWDEPKHKLKFSKRRIYDLTGANIELLPRGLARKRRWSKKYPICITVKKGAQLCNVTLKNSANDALPISSYHCKKEEMKSEREACFFDTEDYEMLTKRSEGYEEEEDRDTSENGNNYDTQNDDDADDSYNFLDCLHGDRIDSSECTTLNHKEVQFVKIKEARGCAKGYRGELKEKKQKKQQRMKNDSVKRNANPSCCANCNPVNKQKQKQTKLPGATNVGKIFSVESENNKAKGKLEGGGERKKVQVDVWQAVDKEEGYNPNDSNSYSDIDYMNDEIEEYADGEEIDEEEEEDEDEEEEEEEDEEEKVAEGNDDEEVEQNNEGETLNLEREQKDEEVDTKVHDMSANRRISHLKSFKDTARKSLGNRKAKDELKIFVFARADREKEDWYRRLVSATSQCVRKRESFSFTANTSTMFHMSPQSTVDTEAKSSTNSFDSVPELTYNAYMTKYLDVDCPTASEDVPFTPSDTTLWINCLIARVLFDVHKRPETINLIQDRIQRKLSNIKLPYFMECLLISEIVIGQGAPVIRNVNKPVMNERGLWLDFDITYKGSLTMTVETKLNLMKLTKTGNGSSVLGNSSVIASSNKHEPLTRSPIFDSDVEDTPETSTEDENNSSTHLCHTTKETTSVQSSGKKFLNMVDRIAANKYFQHATELSYVRRAMEGVSNTEIRLMVTVSSIEGCLSINIPPAPSDRLWYGFKPVPKVTLTVKPAVGERTVNIVYITKWIEAKLLREFEKLIVLPNMDDLVLPLCPNYPYATMR